MKEERQELSPLKTLPYVLLAMAMLLLANCTPMTELGVGSAGVAWMTAPLPPDKADLADQIPSHEDWCYSTLGDAECYAYPQNTAPSRLVNVDPENRYPLTNQEYIKAAGAPQVPLPPAPAFSQQSDYEKFIAKFE